MIYKKFFINLSIVIIFLSFEIKSQVLFKDFLISNKFEEKFIIKNYTSRDGLPQNSVNDLKFDSKGFLWIATEGGLSVFDGTHFVNFNSSMFPELKTNRFKKIYIDSKDNVYLMGDAEKLIKFDGKEFKYLNDSINILLTDKVHYFKDFFFDLKNNLWILQDGRLIKIAFTYEENKVQDWKFDSFGNNFFSNVYYDNIDDKVYFVSGNRLLYFDGVSFSEAKFKNAKKNIYEFLNLGNGKYFIAYDNYFAILDYEFNELIKKKSIFQISDSYNVSACKTNFGYIFVVSTDFSLALDYNLNQYDLAEYLGKYYRLKIVETGLDQSVWIGSNRSGLIVLNLKEIKSILVGQKFYNNFYPILKISDREFLAGSYEDGIFRISDNSFKTVRITKYPGAIYRYSKDEVLIGDGYGDIYLLNLKTDETKLFRFKEKLKSSSIQSIFKDNQNIFWIATLNGIIKINKEGTPWYFSQVFGKESITAYDINQSDDGTIYIGTTRGVLKYYKNKFEKIPLLKNEDVTIRNIQIESSNIIWFSSYGHGVFYYNTISEKIANLNVSSGLLSNEAHTVINDGAGYYWIPTNKGLQKINVEAMLNFIEGKIDFITSRPFDYRDSLISDEFNGGVVPCFSLFEKDSIILFPTLKGIVSAKIINDTFELKKDYIKIFQLQYDGYFLGATKEISIPAETKKIKIFYSTSASGKTIRRLYQTKLEGLEKEWSLPTLNNYIEYSFLPKGNYLFKVRSAKLNGEVIEDSIRINIEGNFFSKENIYSFLIIMIGLTLLIFGFAKYLRQFEQIKNLSEENKLIGDNLILQNEEINSLNQENFKLNENIKTLNRDKTLLDIRLKHEVLGLLKFYKALSTTFFEISRNIQDFEKASVFFNNGISDIYRNLFSIVIKDKKEESKLSLIDVKDIIQELLHTSELSSHIKKNNAYFYANGKDFIVKADKEKLKFCFSSCLKFVFENSISQMGFVLSLNLIEENQIKFSIESFDLNLSIDEVLNKYNEHLNCILLGRKENLDVVYSFIISRVYIDEINGAIELEKITNNKFKLNIFLQRELI